MSRVLYLPAARADLDSIARYIADDNPDRADSFVAELAATAERAAMNPFGFPARDDLAHGLRAAGHGRYLLFYRVADDAIAIVRVLHGARDLERLFNA